MRLSSTFSVLIASPKVSKFPLISEMTRWADNESGSSNRQKANANTRREFGMALPGTSGAAHARTAPFLRDMGAARHAILSPNRSRDNADRRGRALRRSKRTAYLAIREKLD